MKSCQWLFLLLFTWIGALNAQTSTINIQWDPNNEPDINHYQLQRAVNSTSNFQNYQTIYHPDTHYSDTNISPGNLYVPGVGGQRQWRYERLYQSGHRRAAQGGAAAEQRPGRPAADHQQIELPERSKP